MTQKEIERLALRSAMGQEVCARITRRVNDDGLVMLPMPAVRNHVGAGAILSAALLCGIPAAAQNSKAQSTAVLMGRLIPAGATSNGLPVNFARGVTLRDVSGHDIYAKVEADGTFTVSAPPGTYEIIAKNNYWHGVTVKSAVLHEGYQSLGDIQPRPDTDGSLAFTTVGEMVATIGPAHWVRHPLAYVRYVSRRIRMKFSQ